MLASEKKQKKHAASKKYQKKNKLKHCFLLFFSTTLPLGCVELKKSSLIYKFSNRWLCNVTDTVDYVDIVWIKENIDRLSIHHRFCRVRH